MPLIVSVYEPAEAPVIVKVEVIDPLAAGATGFGPKEQVAPDGQFVTERVTALL